MIDDRDERTPPRGTVRAVTPARRIPQALQWQEGMLLAPHHFQQLTLRTEELLSYQTGLALPYAWGVRRFDVDRDALARGWFRVSELEAVMPDGLVVTLPEDRSLEIHLEMHKEALEGGRPVPVYLVVPRRRQEAAPVIAETARYRAVAGDSVLDENTGQGEQRIPRLLPRLSLLVTDRPSGDFARLPLARVTYRDNQTRLEPYVPPLLTLVPDADAPGAPIVERVQNVAARLRGKAKYLAESRTAQSLGTRMKIQALVSGLPLLEELLVSEAIHPRTLYLALCSLAGPLAMLRLEEPMPPELPRYDHTDLLATFSRAEQAIDTVLDEGVSELYTDHVFELDKQRNVFHIFFEKAWQDRELVLGVRRGSGQTEADVEAWMAEALIGAQSLVTEMQKARILGVARKKLDSHAELAASSSVTLYEIRPESKYLKAGERLLAFNPRGGARPAEIVLYVKNRDRAD